MWFRRVLALIIAVGLVYGAWQARVRLIGQAGGEAALLARSPIVLAAHADRHGGTSVA